MLRKYSANVRLYNYLLLKNHWMRFFVISGIIMVEVSVISRSECRDLSETLIIPDITKKKKNLIIVLLYIVVKKMAKSAPLKNTVWNCSWRSCIVRSTQVLVSYLLSDNQLICRLCCLLKSTIIICRLLANEKRRVLDLRTRTTTGTGFNLKFFRVF